MLTFPCFVMQAASGLDSDTLCIRQGSCMCSPCPPPPPPPPLASFTRRHWLCSPCYTGALHTSPCLHTCMLPSSQIMQIQLACSTLCMRNQTTMDFLPLLSTSCCSTTCCLYILGNKNTVADTLSHCHFDITYSMVPSLHITTFQPPRLTLGVVQL